MGGRLLAKKKVAMSSTIPVDCLLGNDLETSTWAEVELKTYAAMQGIPQWVCVKTRAQTKAKGEQEVLEPEITTQETSKRNWQKGWEVCFQTANSIGPLSSGRRPNSPRGNCTRGA